MTTEQIYIYLKQVHVYQGLKVMRIKRKKGLIIAGGVVALFVIAVIVTVLLFDINSYKSKIETVASEATSMDVRINGKMGLSFFPFGVSAKDIHVAGKGGVVLSLERLKLGAELMPLLRKQLKITDCELVKPAITIVKDAEGKYNFESTEKKPKKGGQGTSFSLNELKLFKGSLVYLDKKTGEKTEINKINLAGKDFSIADTSGDIIKNISFTGNIDCNELRKKDLKIDSIKSGIKAEKGIFSLKPLTMDIFGAKGEGNITVDKTEADAEYKINLNVSKLDFQKLQESFGAKKLISGKGDLAAFLTVKEKEGRKPLNGMDGTLSLQGNNLITYTVDLDKVLSTFEASQKFNLVDVGAFFIAGPLGSAALRGYRYGDVYYQAQGGRGTITQFVSHWKIKSGVADARDCAFATQHNRVALKGKLNLISERYDNVTVALLDNKGCAKFKQSISGPFGAPRIGALSTVESLAGPILNLFNQTKRFVQAGKCEVFYSGSVQQPR
ncbi:MAG: AsmA family protein [Proteobacteria bacterium]|nr:AsmA family protein [Pseudomonadota bacterium]